MKKNILVIAAITSASFAIFNLGNPSANLGKISDSTIALERWSEVSQNLSSQANESDDKQGYTGTNEDGEQEEVTTSS
jgi:hypothetical protein